MNFGMSSSQIAEEMFGRKPTTYIRSPVEGARRKRAEVQSTPEAVIGNSMLMHQALVKVVRDGGIKTKGALAKQMNYISRKGKLDVERATGIGDRDVVDDRVDVIKDWEADFARADPRTTFYTYHMIVSYPRDTDDAAARVAAEDFASTLAGGAYGDEYKYMIAHHRDTNNPHAHIILNRIGAQGRTLQINRQSISTDDLRQLHVETSRDVGINLNATSRFSRGIEERTVALGRLKAEQEGRGLSRVAQPKRRATEFPFYGASQREDIDAAVLRDAKAQNIQRYQTVANILGPMTSKNVLPVVEKIGQSINALKQGEPLKRSDQMATNDLARQTQEPRVDGVDPLPQNPKEALADVNNDIRVFFEGMREKVDKIPDEEKRSAAEATYSRALQELAPVMTEETKSRFGKYFVEDDRTQRDNSAAFQRLEATKDIRDNRTDDMARDRSQKSDRETQGQERLSKADQAVVDRFTDIGFSGKLAMERIKQGSSVDRETRQQWFERDVKTHANTNSLSEKQARSDLSAAYGDATGIYKEARKDIRNINRADISQTRTEQEAPSRFKPVDQVVDDLQTPQAATINKRTDDQERQSQSGQRQPPNNNPRDQAQSAEPFSVTGVIKEIGEKLYRADDPQSSSPYIRMTQDDGRDRDVWGIAMPDLVERYRLKEGDRATLTHIGSEKVQVKQTDPRTGEQNYVMADRRAWEASNIERTARTQAREGDRTDQRNSRDDDDRGVSR